MIKQVQVVLGLFMYTDNRTQCLHSENQDFDDNSENNVIEQTHQTHVKTTREV